MICNIQLNCVIVPHISALILLLSVEQLNFSSSSLTTEEMGRSVFSPEILAMFTRKIWGGECEGMSSGQVQKRWPEIFGRFKATTFRATFLSIAKNGGGSANFRNDGMYYAIIVKYRYLSLT